MKHKAKQKKKKNQSPFVVSKIFCAGFLSILTYTVIPIFGIGLGLGLGISCKSSNKKDTAKTDQEYRNAKKKTFTMDRIRYIVLDEPITQYEITAYTKFLRSRGQKGNLRKEAENLLIEQILVTKEAKRLSIIIGPDRLESEVKNRQIASKLKSKDFRKKMEKVSGLSYEQWKEAIGYEILKVYFIQLGLNVTPPSESQMRSYYKSKKKEIATEISYRQIILPVRGKGFDAELAVSNKANTFYKKVRKNPRLFRKLAKRLKGNIASAKNYAALPPYQLIITAASEDYVLASILDQTKEKKASPPFRDARNRYRVIYVEDKRSAGYAKVRNFIQQQLFYERASKQFASWLSKEKKRSDIIRL